MIKTDNIRGGKWHELPFKDKVAHITSVSSFILGWIVAFIGLCLPPMGEIDPTVITVFGMAIGYCGAMYGIITYTRNAQAETYHACADMINEAITRDKQ